MEVVASLSQGRTAAAQCGLFTHKSVSVIFEPPCTYSVCFNKHTDAAAMQLLSKVCVAVRVTSVKTSLHCSRSKTDLSFHESSSSIFRAQASDFMK